MIDLLENGDLLADPGCQLECARDPIKDSLALVDELARIARPLSAKARETLSFRIAIDNLDGLRG